MASKFLNLSVDNTLGGASPSDVKAVSEKAIKGYVDGVTPTESTVSGWGFTKNAGTVTSVNNVSPVNGNVTISIPTVTVTDVQINGTSILSSKVANIVTNTAYDASSNKIATMSDLPTGLPSQTSQSGKYLTTNGTTASWSDVPEEIAFVEYNVTSFADVITAFESGKTVICKQTHTSDTQYFNLVTYLHNGPNYMAFIFQYNLTQLYVQIEDGVTVWESVSVKELPSQSGNNGKLLTTDGSSASWTGLKTINSSSLIGTGNISITGLPSQTSQSGKFLTTNGTSASWANIPTEIPTQTGNSGKYLTTNGTSVSWASITVPSKISDLTDDTSTYPVDKADTLTGLTASITELNYVDGVTSAIQTQLDGKLSTKPDGTNDLIDSNSKVNITYLPDVVLGQMLYAGTFVPSTAVATLSTNAKTILGTTSNTITLTNDTTAITGYAANEGNYYIASGDGTFASISFLTGDWLISTGSGWTKVSNTDAVTGVKGNAENSYRTGNVNITADNVLPTQTSNSGKFLTTNGTTASWGSALTNTATGTESLTIGGTASTLQYNTNIGIGSVSSNVYGVAIGRNAKTTNSQATAIGSGAEASGLRAIQIGNGTNYSDNSLSVGFSSSIGNYKLLDGTTGLIPDARISSNIARTSQIPAGLPSQTGHANDVLTTDGTDASWADTTAVYPIIETYSNGDDWYKIYAPDSTGYRWCVQASLYYKGSTMAATDNEITFLKPFANINYTFIPTPLHSTANLNQYQIYEKYVSRTTSTTVLRTTSAIFGYAWIAYGYIADEAS